MSLISVEYRTQIMFTEQQLNKTFNQRTNINLGNAPGFEDQCDLFEHQSFVVSLGSFVGYDDGSVVLESVDGALVNISDILMEFPGRLVEMKYWYLPVVDTVRVAEEFLRN